MNFCRHNRSFPAVALVVVAALPLAACKRNMYEEPKFLPDQQNYYFPKEPADRQPVAHTVSSSPLDENPVFDTGMTGATLATAFPIPVTPGLVAKGREEFDINCSACHGRDGYGDGIVVQRGFPAPPSYHSERLRNAAVGHFFDVITNGYGVMYPFGSRIRPADRWAIVAYIRALQLSQNAPVPVLSARDKTQLESGK
jgi:mono/diheme cytochrome c family protein